MENSKEIIGNLEELNSNIKKNKFPISLSIQQQLDQQDEQIKDLEDNPDNLRADYQDHEAKYKHLWGMIPPDKKDF